MPFFDDADADIDWRHLSWGGVFIDDRPLGDPDGCPGGCIPALDDPRTTDAAGGDWYPDDRIVFGIVEGDEALAIPMNIAEIHEMFNLTLGDQRLGDPVLHAVRVGAGVSSPTSARRAPVMRTSGLLSPIEQGDVRPASRSRCSTRSPAHAVSGPLQDAGVVLDEITVVRSTWGEWKRGAPRHADHRRRTAASVAATTSTRSVVATTTARSSRSATSTNASACRSSSSA